MGFFISEIAKVRIFAIADLHFSSVQPKPMDIFGEGWEGHETKIRDNWNRVVEDDDLVLIPGDISWAMKLEDAKLDLDAVGSFNGRKIIIKGNHDYWWAGINKVRKVLPPTISALQNDSIVCNGVAIVGTRGWLYPNLDSDNSSSSGESSAEVDEANTKVYKREIERMTLSLESLKKQSEGFDIIIAMMHFMPFALVNIQEGNDSFVHKPTDFTNLLESYSVSKCVYGHLHGEYRKLACEGEINGVEYRLVSCDAIDFTPAQIV